MLNRLLNRIQSIGAFASVGFFSIACAANSPAAESLPSNQPATIYKDIVYHETSERDLRLDFYLNKTARAKKTPVLVHFHGGGWMRGAPPKSWGGFQEFFKAGFSVATVEYRLGGEALAPAAVQDARCAVKWIAEQSVPFNIDTNKIVVMGTSSGGHLALMTGLLDEHNSVDLKHCKGAPKVAAIVDFYGPTDLTIRQPRTGKRPKSFVKWTGDGEDGFAMAKLMSPLLHLKIGDPPIFIAHGDADPFVPYSLSIEFLSHLHRLQIPNRMVTIKGGKHGKFSKREHALITRELFHFFKEIDILESD